MGVVIGHHPRRVAVPRAAREAHRDAGGNAEEPEHQRHRTGEVLTVPRLRPPDEDLERWTGNAGRRLVVSEPSRLAEPRLESQNGAVRGGRGAGDTPRDVVHRRVPAVTGVRRIAQEDAHRALPLRGRESREHAAIDLEEARHRRGCPNGSRREGPRRRVRRVAPHRVVLAGENRIAHAQNPTRELEDRSDPPGVESDGSPCGSEVVVDQRLDLHTLLEPVSRVRGALGYELREL